MITLIHWRDRFTIQDAERVLHAIAIVGMENILLHCEECFAYVPAVVRVAPKWGRPHEKIDICLSCFDRAIEEIKKTREMI